MTLTPSTVRSDLKCGKGAISKGEKCTKGTVSKASVTENLLKFGGAAGVVASLAYAGRPNSNVFGAISGLNTSIGAIASGVAMEGARKKNKAKQLLATSIAASNFGAAAFNAHAAHSVSRFNKQYKKTTESYRRSQSEANRSWNQAWSNVGGGRTGSAGANRSRNGGVESNKAITDPYRDLSMNERAPDVEIKKRWLQLMKENHPDVGGDPQKAQQINAAYQEILRRRGKRDSIYADGFHIDLEAIAL